MKIERLKKIMTKKRKKKRHTSKDYLSTGSAQLDIAISGKVGRGFLKGHYYQLYGTSRSGKTFLSLTCCAELVRNKNFDDYRIIYDNSEDGALMNIEKFFGKKVAERMEPPGGYDTEGLPVYSKTIEELYYHLDDAIHDGRPFLYIEDSMDALSSLAERKKFREHKKAHREGKASKGEMTDGKAKKNSSGLRQVVPNLTLSGSILILISQTRDNMDYGFEPRSISGGNALKFYATLQIESLCGKTIKKTVREKDRIIGMNCELRVRKNRVTGRDRNLIIPIFYEIGMDDIGGCVNWLVEEKHWRKSGNSIIVPEFDFKGTRAKLIHKIENEELTKDLHMIVQEVWDDIEEACNPKRKKRYE